MSTYTVEPEWESATVVRIEVEEGKTLLQSGQELTLRPLAGHQNVYEIRIGSTLRHAVVEANSRGMVSISFQGYQYLLKVSDSVYARFHAILKENLSATQQLQKVVAPMPGLIKNVSIHNGQSVRKGEKLFVLEAMKMENIIKAPGSGVVRNLDIAEGSAVEKGTLLCVLDAQSAASQI